ncbi:MAG: N-formylglutamate amidohydrolase [Pseudomonadota bacterium]|nr:N-formylglutamate amidohydrolase [Pseudomonadota bacterium]
MRIEGDPGRGCLVICDHASNALPPGFGTLGLPEGQFDRHIAYDIGAAGVARGLARRLGVPAVLSCWSRLLIDPNRAIDDPTLVMQLSDGAVVPGNAGITTRDVARRIADYHEPYHQAISDAIASCIAAGKPPVILSVHSFTPAWKRAPRPWHVTILWDKDPRMARPLLAELGRDRSLVVGENEPYTGKLKGDCLYRHGTRKGLPHALIEVRQDLIASGEGQEEWAERLARAVNAVMASPEGKEINAIEYHGSHTDEKAGTE